MNRPFLDLSGRFDDRPMLLALRGFQVVSEVAAVLGIPFFVVGATARDLVLQYGYEIKAARLTHDVDLAVQVASWEQFKELTDGLVRVGGFERTRELQRFFFRGVPLDIIPFGAIGSLSNSIRWPPDNDIVMDILGFEEAFANALLVRFSADPLLEIKVVAPSGWALLKIIAWKDRDPGKRNKDAKDLALLLRNYSEAGNGERLYAEPHATMLAEEDFDVEMAGARLLGRDIAKIASESAISKARVILAEGISEQLHFPLLVDMAESRLDRAGEFEKNLQLVSRLQAGIEETL